ncbi:hypothetical protein HanIR_Chr15g0746681 [Helianthus annuus]|nr:hypothetical protein HanIR_Chr15g0746681 [Helianthus annuus]
MGVPTTLRPKGVAWHHPATSSSIAPWVRQPLYCGNERGAPSSARHYVNGRKGGCRWGPPLFNY